jgi:hypothetical protein
MKRLLSAFTILAANAFSYSYYLTDPLTSLQSNNWYVNGDAQFGTNGYSSLGGGALISKVAVPDGTSEYEVKATLRGTAPYGSGDQLTLLLHASSDSNGYNSGTYYAVTFSPGSSLVTISKRVQVEQGRAGQPEATPCLTRPKQHTGVSP